MTETVYIAGSVTNGGSLTPEQIRERCDWFDAKEADLTSYGYRVVNPTKLGACRPHQVEQTPEASAHAMRDCLAALVQCDTIYLLRGWEQSHYAWVELQVAQACGLAVETQPGGTPWNLCNRCQRWDPIRYGYPDQRSAGLNLLLFRDCPTCGPVMLCRRCRAAHHEQDRS